MMTTSCSRLTCISKQMADMTLPVVGMFVIIASCTPPLMGTSITLLQDTATFSQAGLAVDQTTDGTTSGLNGWAINPSESNPQTAVWETDPLSVVGGPGGTSFTFTLMQQYGGNHTLGRFRLSVTTADRTTFADGNTGVLTPGDVGAPGIWTELTPLTASDAALQTETFTINLDNSISVTDDSPATATYIVTATTTFTGITGIRLEALKYTNPAEGNGPGRAATATGGNFLLSEFQVDAVNLVPEPGSAVLLALGAVGFLGRGRYRKKLNTNVETIA